MILTWCWWRDVVNDYRFGDDDGVFRPRRYFAWPVVATCEENT